MNPWKRRFLLETIIFRCYASFREGIHCWQSGVCSNRSAYFLDPQIDHIHFLPIIILSFGARNLYPFIMIRSGPSDLFGIPRTILFRGKNPIPPTCQRRWWAVAANSQTNTRFFSSKQMDKTTLVWKWMDIYESNLVLWNDWTTWHRITSKTIHIGSKNVSLVFVCIEDVIVTHICMAPIENQTETCCQRSFWLLMDTSQSVRTQNDFVRGEKWWLSIISSNLISSTQIISQKQGHDKNTSCKPWSCFGDLIFPKDSDTSHVIRKLQGCFFTSHELLYPNFAEMSKQYQAINVSSGEGNKIQWDFQGPPRMGPLTHTIPIPLP